MLLFHVLSLCLQANVFETKIFFVAYNLYRNGPQLVESQDPQFCFVLFF